MNSLNELTNSTRTGTLTLAGNFTGSPTNVTVSGTGLSAGSPTVYGDGSWTRAGATLANGSNYYSATATDSRSRTASDASSFYLPSTNAFLYDANGNLLSDGQRYFAYDDENQLVSVTVSNAWRSEFAYDGFMRRRLRKEFAWSGSDWLETNEVHYVYDGNLVIQERDELNVPAVTYTRGNDLSGSLQGAGGIGGLLARTDNHGSFLADTNANAFYGFDGNGNVTALVNAAGRLVAAYSYDPYGKLLRQAGPFAEANKYRFSTKEFHSVSSTYYYGFRFFDPDLQRWLNQDPIGETGGVNLYAYAGGSPIDNIDSRGLEAGYDYINGRMENHLNRRPPSPPPAPPYPVPTAPRPLWDSRWDPYQGAWVPLAEMQDLSAAYLEAGLTAYGVGEACNLAKSALNVGLSQLATKATAPVEKFSQYIFKEGATHGKDVVFKGLGYGAEDSAQLAKLWEQQAAAKYAKGEYTLGKLDQYGQRINITIDVPGVGAAAGKSSSMTSGWMVKPDGTITLNTPFSGFPK